MAEIVTLTKNGETAYPVTKPDAVIDNDGYSLLSIWGKKGVISQMQNWSGGYNQPRTYTMSNQVYGLIPQYFIDMVKADGVMFNDTGEDIATTDYYGDPLIHKAGCFLINGLGDVSYEELLKIYNYPKLRMSTGRCYLYGQGQANHLRTNPPTTTRTVETLVMLARFNDGIETISLENPNGELGIEGGGSLSVMFWGCNKLRKVLGVIALQANTNVSLGDIEGGEEPSLTEIRIKGVNKNIAMKGASSLSLNSIVYMVENAGNTNAITITLHASTFARCQADTTEYTYNGNTYIGVINFAAAKNITITDPQ